MKIRHSVKIAAFLTLVILLTILTQVGGFVLILSIPAFVVINRNVNGRVKRRMAKILSYTAVYLLLTFTLIPALARYTGRVPLPVWSHDNLKPLSLVTCLLNRHYVAPRLLRTMREVAGTLDQNYPGTTVSYLDANFPFIDGFPMLPHLSHNDGRKVDLAFLYQNADNGNPVNNEAPSPIGYGKYESPKKGEIDQPQICENKGYWQYGIIGRLIPDWQGKALKLDIARTKGLLKLLSKQRLVSTIFLEPHLQTRMELNDEVFKYHGCHSVRHDDHIHIEISR